MTLNDEPRQARTEFEWHLRGCLVTAAAIVTAATLASIAGAFTLILVIELPVLMTTITADVFSPPGQSASVPAWVATASLIGAVLLGAGVGWHVFSKVSCFADQFFGRFELLPPPFAGED